MIAFVLIRVFLILLLVAANAFFAAAEFALNTMTEAAGVALPPHQPLLHFARRQDVVAWAPQRIRPK